MSLSNFTASRTLSEDGRYTVAGHVGGERGFSAVCADERRRPMKKVVGLIKDVSVEQRSRVKEAVQTAMQDGSLQVEYVS